MVGHMPLSPSLSERSVFKFFFHSVYSMVLGAWHRLLWHKHTRANTQAYVKHTHAFTALSAFAEFSCLITAGVSHVAVVEAVCVLVCGRTGTGPTLSTAVWLPIPTPPTPTCRGMRPSRGVPRGCLPGLDFVSLSADLFLCLRSRSPRPRSPRQRPRPRHHSQRHWPALTLSGKLSLARLASPWHDPLGLAWGHYPGLLCLHTDRRLHPLCITSILVHNWPPHSLHTFKGLCLSSSSWHF